MSKFYRCGNQEPEYRDQAAAEPELDAWSWSQSSLWPMHVHVCVNMYDSGIFTCLMQIKFFQELL